MEKIKIDINWQERTILDRVARGWSFEEIQQELETSPIEVKRLCHTAMNKINARTVAQAACYAVWAGMIYPFDTPSPAVKGHGRWRRKAVKETEGVEG